MKRLAAIRITFALCEDIFDLPEGCKIIDVHSREQLRKQQIFELIVEGPGGYIVEEGMEIAAMSPEEIRQRAKEQEE